MGLLIHKVRATRPPKDSLSALGSVLSSTKWLRNLIFLLAATLCCLAYYTGAGRIRGPVNPLTISEKDLSLGHCWETNHLERQLTIRNTSNYDVTIDNFAASCNCVGISPNSAVIPANGETSLRMSLDLTKGAHSEAAMSDDRLFSATLIARGYGRVPVQQYWTLQALVRPKIVLTPSVVYFGPTLTKDNLRPRIVRVTCALPTENLLVNDKQALFDLKVKRLSPQEFELAVIPKPDPPIGPFALVVPISTADDHSNGVRLSLYGKVVQDIQAFPDEVVLGAEPIGDWQGESVVFSSLSGRPFSVEGIRGTSPATQVEPLPNSAKSSKTFTIRQHIVGEGDQQNLVVFSMRTADGRLSKVEVPVVYHGVSR